MSKIKKKKNRSGDLNTNNKNMQLGLRNGNLALKKCTMVHNEKMGKREELEGNETAQIRTLGEKENFKYLGALKADTIKPNWNDRISKKGVPQKKKKNCLKPKVLQQKSYQRNKTAEQSPLLRYSGSFLRWTKVTLRQMDKKRQPIRVKKRKWKRTRWH